MSALPPRPDDSADDVDEGDVAPDRPPVGAPGTQADSSAAAAPALRPREGGPETTA